MDFSTSQSKASETGSNNAGGGTDRENPNETRLDVVTSPFRQTSANQVSKRGDELELEKLIANKLLIIICLCALFMLLEMVGGWLANSLAIACDAFHLLTDLFGFLISLGSSHLASLEATKSMNFGFRRVEVLGAFTSVIFIWLLTGGLFYASMNRLFYADYHIDAAIMIGVAVAGVLFNSIMALALSYTPFAAHAHCSSSATNHATKHSHASSHFMPPKIIADTTTSDHQHHQHHTPNSKETVDVEMSPTPRPTTTAATTDLQLMVSRNINIRAAFIHILGDLIQSVGVLVASIIIYIRPSLQIADPICTILFSVIVLATTLPIMGDILRVLSESFPKQLDYAQLVDALERVSGVRGVLELKVWSLSTDTFAANAIVALSEASSSHDAAESKSRTHPHHHHQKRHDDHREIIDQCHNALLAINPDFRHIVIQLERSPIDQHKSNQ